MEKVVMNRGFKYLNKNTKNGDRQIINNMVSVALFTGQNNHYFQRRKKCLHGKLRLKIKSSKEANISEQPSTTKPGI
jgi:hypothetical protein